jgi:hypothetical protein
MTVMIVQHFPVITDNISGAVLLLPLSAWLLWRSGLARIDARSMAWWLALLLLAVLSLALNAGESAVSWASSVFLAYLTAPFVLAIRAPGEWRRRGVRFWLAFRLFMVSCALLGLGQVLLGEHIVSFRDLLPEAWRLEGYNTTNAVEYGSSIYRANGFFFLEPSFFVQFLAVAILVELRTWRNPAVLALFSVAMISAFAGTGFMLLAVGLLVMAGGAFRRLTRRELLLLLLPPAVLAVFVVYVFPDLLLARANEFTQENSSAYIRFVSPMLYIWDAYTSSALNVLLGVGPGVASSVRLADVMADFAGLAKMMFEYGLLGAFAITALYLRFSRKAGLVAWLGWPMLLVQFVLNNGIFTPVTLVLFILCALHGSPAAFEAAAAQRVRRRSAPGASGAVALPLRSS